MFGRRPSSRAGSRGGRPPAPPREPAVIHQPSPPEDEGPRRVAAVARPRLVDLCGEWLSLAAALRGASGVSDVAALKAQALELRDRLAQEARAAGFSATDVDAATFAIVAFLDETVLAAAGPARDAWMSRPLGLELFGIMTAGQEFFDRLERMRRERDSRIEALEVFYACLLLGFAGKYKLESREKLAALTSEVERDIVAVRPIGERWLSPHGVRREESVAAVAESLPSWLSLVFFVIAVGLAWLVIFLLARLGANSAIIAIERPTG